MEARVLTSHAGNAPAGLHVHSCGPEFRTEQQDQIISFKKTSFNSVRRPKDRRFRLTKHGKKKVFTYFYLVLLIQVFLSR